MFFQSNVSVEIGTCDKFEKLDMRQVCGHVCFFNPMFLLRLGHATSLKVGHATSLWSCLFFPCNVSVEIGTCDKFVVFCNPLDKNKSCLSVSMQCFC